MSHVWERVKCFSTVTASTTSTANFIETQPPLLLQPPQMLNKYPLLNISLHKSLDASHLLKKTLNTTERLLMMDSIQSPNPTPHCKRRSTKILNLEAEAKQKMELEIHKNQQIVLKKIEGLIETLVHQMKPISKSLNSLTLIKAVKRKNQSGEEFKIWNRIIEETVIV